MGATHPSASMSQMTPSPPLQVLNGGYKSTRVSSKVVETWESECSLEAVPDAGDGVAKVWHHHHGNLLQ
ncbi:hypothetical protein L7F22_011319, partial [Adiantum nelumboides]|nr:hypothetical protein [Adiantum nelumboides]